MLEAFMNIERQPALLLLGPTGAGKTPLGQMLEARGLHDRQCVHFDFGENMRKVVAQNAPNAWISQSEMDFLRSVLESGVLLEDRHFPIAERIFQAFLAERTITRQTWVVLNGLPRHVGQALALETIADIQAVLCLECSSESVFRRIGTNAGGDRTGRQDDDFQAVAHKLEIYRTRTTPLISHYQSQGVPILSIEVTEHTTTEAMYQAAAESAAWEDKK
jgi:adenylate kinase family enzyme